jgi:SPP1 family predicted phage head-tail adaptor
MLDVSEVFTKFEANYTRTRYAIINTYNGEERVGTDATVRAYIHPNDYKTDVYNAQGVRLEQSIKIFCKRNTDITNNDEVVYEGKRYKVTDDNSKIVGAYKKLLGELVI